MAQRIEAGYSRTWQRLSETADSESKPDMIGYVILAVALIAILAITLR
jgi:hypothetical protein